MNNKLNQRQDQIIGLLNSGHRLHVRELAERFAVSEMTIRRDMNALQAEGLLLRTYGGGVAVAASQSPGKWPTSPQKTTIGSLAADLVTPNQTVLLDSGTTTLEVARHLPQDASLSVATISLEVAQALYGSPMRVILFGGILHHEVAALYGPMTERAIQGFHVDTLFIGCDGAQSDAGFYTADLHLSSLEQAMIAIADRVVVVTESSKFNRHAFTRFASVPEVDIVVTDAAISADDRQHLEDQGVTVLVADNATSDQ